MEPEVSKHQKENSRDWHCLQRSQLPVYLICQQDRQVDVKVLRRETSLNCSKILTVVNITESKMGQSRMTQGQRRMK